MRRNVDEIYVPLSGVARTHTYTHSHTHTHIHTLTYTHSFGNFIFIQEFLLVLIWIYDVSFPFVAEY
jgi:hypothetical protein